MIGSLRGEVLERNVDGTVLIEVGGVGYLVTVSQRTMAELEPSTNAFLYVHHHIREDAQTLYGFLSRDERDCWKISWITRWPGRSAGWALPANTIWTGLVWSQRMPARWSRSGCGRGRGCRRPPHRHTPPTAPACGARPR